MCGIFGFNKSTDVTALLTPMLAYEMLTRGKDSWGVTDGVVLHKDVGPIVRSWNPIGLALDGPIYHTRAASVGGVSIRNAHPFKFSGPRKTVVGIHNGHLSNYYALKQKYKRDSAEVDSEQIFMHLAEELDLGEIDGWGAVAWYEYPNDKPEEKVLFLSRFGQDNLHIADLDTPDSEIVFASTRNAIEAACKFAGIKIKQWYEIVEKKLYSIEPSDRSLIVYKDPLPWCKNPIRTPVSHNSYNYNSDSWAERKKKTCRHKGCNNHVNLGTFMCSKCFTSLTIEYVGAIVAEREYKVHTTKAN